MPVDEFVEAVRRFDPQVVGVSYRLTPEVGIGLLTELRNRLAAENLLDGRKFVFGGTPPMCRAAEELRWFDRCFDGLEAPHAVWNYLSGKEERTDCRSFGDNLMSRLDAVAPYPLLRHHFGLPSLEETIAGVGAIADSGVVDVISLAPDQNAQESFFRPEEMDPALDGAGGVPIRTEADLRRIHEARCRGNQPLLRIYSGTRDLIKWAKLATDTIGNAWGAIPLCWYSGLDGRSKRTTEEAIRENQQAMRWYGERGIPVEVNEAHHWSMRDAHDVIAVVMAYLAAYNAKRMGVGHYIAQYMFNSPPSTRGAMDLAKMLAKIELIESLHDDRFVTSRQVRAGLLHLSPRENIAKGQLAASTMLAMQLRPHIIHVVGYCEGDHAATAGDVIESCEIVHGVLRNSHGGMPDMTHDPIVIGRRDELLSEARVLLESIEALNRDDAFTDPRTLAVAIETGMLDAPHLRGNTYAAGRLETRVIDGAVYAFDSAARRILNESERLEALKAAPAVRSTKGVL